mgnify:CR=1 FL=1
MPCLPILDRTASVDATGKAILAPLVARLGARTGVPQAELLGLLPLGDANAALRAALAETAGPVSGHLFAGILAVDPFVDWERFADELLQRQFAAVAALPSLAPLSGRYAANLAEVDLGFAQEVARLGWFHRRGFRTAGLACDAEQAERLLAVGCDLLLLHPGPLDPPAVAAAADRMSDLLRRVPRPPLGRYLFVPQPLAAACGEALSTADGHVVLLPGPSPCESRP